MILSSVLVWNRHSLGAVDLIVQIQFNHALFVSALIFRDFRHVSGVAGTTSLEHLDDHTELHANLFKFRKVRKQQR